MKKKGKKPVKFYKKIVSSPKYNYKWIIGIVFWTFLISCTISYTSDIMISNVNLFVAFLILTAIVFMGILFDIIGVAVTAADEIPFHSMASRKVKGAKTAVYLIRNADKVSNFCNDVIGDVISIISGTIGAVIIGRILTFTGGSYKTLLTLGISALIASITVGGKAFGKYFAISQSNNIVYSVAWLMETVKRK